MEDWSNERMGDEGRETSSMSDGTASALEARTAALVRVAAAVARGNPPELKARLAAARDARVPGLWIEELLLQSMLVVGYPLALVAFGAWRAGGGAGPGGGGGGFGGRLGGWGPPGGRGWRGGGGARGGAPRGGGGRGGPRPGHATPQ